MTIKIDASVVVKNAIRAFTGPDGSVVGEVVESSGGKIVLNVDFVANFSLDVKEGKVAKGVVLNINTDSFEATVLKKVAAKNLIKEKEVEKPKSKSNGAGCSSREQATSF